jgi:serine/threonine-protein kinase
VSGVGPGDVIAGKFRVERVLGEGGMGYVVAARHLQLGQIVALKFMREEICTPDYKSRFLREARNTVRLKSKHVSRVLDVGALDGGSPYMVMEYLEGTDLSELLQKDGPLPAQLACEYILQACEAIAEAHGHGIVHRDLKPANLFLTRGQSGEPVVKVLDFGVSKVLDVNEETNPGGRRREDPDSVVTKVSDLLGSPSYMAPEQVISARDADARSDIWSLGVILFRLISGVAPFTGVSLGEVIQSIMHGPIPDLRDARPDLPPGLEHVVARCLQRERENRLGDVIELARMLAPFAGAVATPSHERIALLGPALVATPLAATHSNPSFGAPPSGAGSWAPPSRPPASGALTRAAPPSRPTPAAPPSQPPKAELTTKGALVWAGVFVLFLGVAALVVAKVVGRARRDAPPPTVAVTTPAVSAGAMPDLPTPPNLDPPPAVVVASDTVGSGAPRALPRGRPHTAPRAADSKASPPTTAPGGDIPSTRE